MKKNNKKGFTLIEVIVAMFVFTLVMSSASITFAKAFRVYSDAKDIQENMENAQYAMNLMAKTFRTSSVARIDGTTSVTVFDYSQAGGGTSEGKCIRYYFNSTSHSIIKAENTVNNLAACKLANPTGGSPITSGNISSARFDIEDSVVDVKVGKVTVSITLEKGENIVNVQTTTSLRDYTVSGVSL